MKTGVIIETTQGIFDYLKVHLLPAPNWVHPDDMIHYGAETWRCLHPFRLYTHLDLINAIDRGDVIE